MGGPGASPSPRPSPRSDSMGSRSEQVAPFIGVVSTSDKESLRLMNGQDHYDEWLFVAGRPRVLGRSGPELRDGNAGVPQGPERGKGPGQTK